ncbi:MAG: amino acid adenylation domain-containing protein [Cyanobacteria bacterium]|jgi:amino acid adenylation domain-containing protein|nr:amino acid adenylation domain-containing protein [Cyanobacteria bacterium GSL.Bin1]
MDTANIEDIYELSPTQQGILFHSLYAPQTGVYVGQLTCCLQGELDLVALEKAWQFVVDQHPILRTAFQWEGLDKPLQIVYRQVQVSIEYQDWRSLNNQKLETYLAQERQRDFDLATAPLMRLTLIQLSEQQYQFVWNKHHLLLDGWSKTLVLKQVLEAYEAFALNQMLPHITAPPYSDYIGWLQQQDLSLAEAFWRQTLAGLTAPTPLEIDRNLTSPTHHTQQEHSLTLSPSTTTALQSLARHHQLTLNTIIQGAWAILLSRYSGENEVVFGATGSGRPASLPRSESMVGLFINTLPARVQVPEADSLIPWLQQLQEQQAQARQYDYTPLVQIQEWSDVPSDLPLFESILVFENYPVDSSLQQLNHSLAVKDVQTSEKTNYPLTALVIPDSELTITIAYDSQRFPQDAIARLCGHLETLLEGMVANPQQQLAELPLLTAEERHQMLVTWNDTQADSRDQCLHELVEAQVKRTPDAIAVAFENEQLRYRELNQRANQLAHYLQSLGVKPDTLVGLYMERSLEMVIGLLGILKAGGAYLPLDPNYPQKRISFMLRDAEMPIILTQQYLKCQLPEHDAKLIALDQDWNIISQQSSNHLDQKLNLDNLAYIIYTSGSTGQPKGVQIAHRALMNFLSAMEQKLNFTTEDTFIALTPLSFDIAGLEVFLPLTLGGKTVIIAREVARDGQQLSLQLDRAEPSIMQATPASWQLLLQAGWQGSQSLKLLCGGEALSPNLAQTLLARGNQLWNLYGPTETTIWSTAQPIQLEDNSISIGSGILNTEVYVLDRQFQPTPIGVPGELYLGGTGLSRGYLKRSELTAERFVPHPYTQQPGKRLYRTGDLVRYCSDGSLEYLGRIDNQVKIRGFRIELEEIEAILSQHSALEQAVVLAPLDRQGNPQLVGYLIANDEHRLSHDDVSCYLQSRLPAYMIPSQFVFLQSFPLTPNGKIDRKALPEPNISAETEETRVMPRTATEKILAEIWCDVLTCDKVGVNKNFFQLGGHSLKATQVVSKVRDQFQIELPIQAIFEAVTIAELSQKIDQHQEKVNQSHSPEIQPISRQARQRKLSSLKNN